MGLAFVPPLPSLPLDSLDKLPRPDSLSLLDFSACTGLFLVAGAAAAIGSRLVDDVGTSTVVGGFGLRVCAQGYIREVVAEGQ